MWKTGYSLTIVKMELKMKSLKLKLIIALLSSVIIPLLVVATVSGRSINRNIRPVFTNMASSELEIIDTYIESYFTRATETLLYLSNFEQLKDESQRLTVYKDSTTETKMDPENAGGLELEIYSEFKNFIDNNPSFTGIEFGRDYGGYIRYPLSDRKPGYNPPERGWYKTAMDNPGRIIITDAAPSSDGKSIDISIVRAIKKSNKIVGVLSLKTTLDFITKIIKKIKIGEEGYLLVVDRSGVVLADPVNPQNNFKKLSEIEYFKNSKILEEGSIEEIKINNEVFLAYPTKSTGLNFRFIAMINRGEIDKTFREFIFTIIIATSTLLIIFTVISIFLSRSISNPIRVISEVFNSIATGEGDLTRELKVLTKDEVGKMAESFNKFTATMSSMIHSIKLSTEDLSESGDNLVEEMNSTASSVHQITANIESTRKQVHNQETRVSSTSSAVEEITQNIESLKQMVDRQAESVNSSSSSISSMVESINSVHGSVEELDRLLESLLKSSDSGKTKINDVYQKSIEISQHSESLQETNEIISNIASQTNLLAMNAAIEAAHAGDAGKGFAVVADEIRSLAETSSDQSQSIGLKLKAITQVIDTIVSASKSAEEAFNLVKGMIDRINTLEIDIRNSINVQLSESKEVTNSLEEITEKTHRVKDGSLEMQAGSRQILQDIVSLSDISKEILYSIEEIANGNKHINESVQMISEMSVTNKEIIEAVNKNVSRFKLKEES